jgi:hypothetical protein
MNGYIIDIVDIILVVVFGISAIILVFKQLERKSFSYNISDTPIISINEKLNDVTVTYKGRPVENLRVVIVYLWNSGNKVIREEDFKVPVSFCATQTARGNSLVVAQIIKEPEGAQTEIIDHKVGHHSYRTALKPILFNPGDRVVVKIIIADYGGENLDVNITGRIAGVKAIKRETYSNINPFLYHIFKDFLIPEDEVKSAKK